MRYESDVISKNIKRNQKIKKILIIILYIMLIPTILFSLLLICLELGNSGIFPSSLNIEIYTVTSESMSPRLKVNDIIIVKKGYTNEEYKVGNIITFKKKNGEIVTHRIDDITTVDLQKAYVTKGDNNTVQDEEIVKYKYIIGKVIYTMPKFGIVMNLLKNKIFFAFCILVLIGIIYYDNRLKKRKLDRKLVREKYEKKSDFYF
ncbi:MAG: signal peptidase I [Clostridia bacterium]|nr:signal peptidase I [Clostridia bacterium]